MGKADDMQAAFVDEYLIDFNATQAAIRAGYAPKSAGEQGCRLLKKRKIADAVARAIAERSRRTGITADRVLRELARVAFVNPSDVIDFDTGTVKASAGADDLAAVASCKVKTMSMGDEGDMVEREIKLNDKIKALDLLGKHLGMYPDGKGTGHVTVPGDDGDGAQTTGVVLLPATITLPDSPPEGSVTQGNAGEASDGKTD